MLVPLAALLLASQRSLFVDASARRRTARCPMERPLACASVVAAWERSEWTSLVMPAAPFFESLTVPHGEVIIDEALDVVVFTDVHALGE